MTLAITSNSDFLARLAFVGIFVVENLHHVGNFEDEVRNLVIPAVGLPMFYSSLYHVLSISLGLIGSITFLLGSIIGDAVIIRRSIDALLVFISMITFVWWIKRDGLWLWDSTDYKQRQIHVMKNIAIAGGLATVRSMLPKSEDDNSGSVFVRLFISTRPWSLPASLVPCLVVLSSITFPVASWLKFTSFLFGVVFLQAASNLFNSYADFQNAVDTKDNSGDRTIVDGYLSSTACFYFASLLCSGWVYCFWYCFSFDPPRELVFLALLGGAIAVFYSLGAMPLKYIGLGDVAVYAAFGPLLDCAAVFAAGSRDWDDCIRACVISAPVSLLVVGILHANNVRDLKTDASAGAKTLAVRLGEPAAIIYYYALCFLPFMLVAVLAKVYSNPGMCLAILALPQAFDLTRRIREKPVHREIPELTAQTMVLFGITQALGAYAWNRCF